ncbi:MAG: hypothetical protein LBS45_00095, partial [Synergistaceae bacterium]|nr:hypothetical protein [Synergistaceae bacterium]
RIIGSLAAHFTNHGIERRFNGAYNGSTRQKKYRGFNGSNSFLAHDHCGNINVFSRVEKTDASRESKISPYFVSRGSYCA